MARGTAPDVSVPDPADLALVAALEAGDHRRTMEILVHAYGEHVYRYCRRVLGKAAESDDLSQTVFEQAFHCWKDLRRVHNVRAWLLGIARNRCIDRLRARRRDPRMLENRDLCAIIDSHTSDGAAAADPQIGKALDACLDRLDARSRAVLVLRFHDGLSFNEIATLMTDTAGALRIRLVRALKGLRRCLERKGVRP